MAAAASTSASKYLTPKPTAIAQGQVNIDHPQLRDLLVCRDERGVVSYLRDHKIVEQHLLVPCTPIRTVAQLSFTPSSLTFLSLGPNDEDTLFAAGGSWNADLHLSYHRGRPGTPLWQCDTKLQGTLNNSVLLTKNHGSSVEPRVGVTNNDRTFRMYDCAVRNGSGTDGGAESDDENSDEDEEGNQILQCVGGLTLDTCVNYASVSPSGRTLLCVGDSPNLYIHNISGSSQISFYPIAVLPIPLPVNTPPHYPTTRPSTFTASFATAFSSDSLHFAIGSQEGVAAIWDIRSASRPMKVWQVDKMRAMGIGGMGAASGWISWDPSDWFHSRAPAWSVRNIKFVGGSRPDGKESLIFTEHTSLMHIIDAKTLEDEETIRVPSKMADPPPPTPPTYLLRTLDSPASYIPTPFPADLYGASGSTTRQHLRNTISVYDSDDEWTTDDDDDDSDETEDTFNHDMSDDEDRMEVDAGSLFAASLLLDLASSGSGSGSGHATHNTTSTRSTNRRRRRRGAGTISSSGTHRRNGIHTESDPFQLLTPPHPPPWFDQFMDDLPFASASSMPTTPPSPPPPASASTSTSARHRHHGPQLSATSSRLRYSHSNPRYIMSDGFAFPADTATLEYRRDDGEDEDEGIVNNTAQGLDIAGMCADPTGKWLYVGTQRGIVEWGLV